MSNKAKYTYLSSLLVYSANHKVMYQTGRAYVKVILALFLVAPSLNSIKREEIPYKILAQTHPYSKGNPCPCFEALKEKTHKLWKASDSLSFIAKITQHY